MRPLSRELRSALWFLYRSVSRAMGCFFACFRVKKEGCAARSRAIRSDKQPEPVLSRNPLSSLFECEETENHKWEDRESNSFESPSTINRELREEAKFLRACGTLKETPDEIRKASRRMIASPPDDADPDRPKFHSGLPPVPLKLGEMLEEDLDSRERTPSSCISDVENTRSSTISSTMEIGEVSVDMPSKYHKNVSDNCRTPLPDGLSITDTRHKNKSVRFECAVDMFSSDNNQNLKISETPGYHMASKNSPYPTPLKLSDDIETPGTVFPASMENLNGQPRIRSQYVYSVLNPVENVSQWKALTGDRYNSNRFSDEQRDSIEQPEDYKMAKQAMQFKEASMGREMNVEASLSSWLKPPTGQPDERRTQFYRTPGDRPIIGLVATHWNEEAFVDNNPKGWDGNGIPNLTNKYKEDQKVSWHATPFEERLEKALSEESFLPQRNSLNGTPLAFDESEESDTAFSQPQPSAHPVAKPVASY